MKKIRTVFTVLTACFLLLCSSGINKGFLSCASAQVLGIPAAEVGEGEWEHVLAAFPQEPPVALFAWGAAGTPNPKGNPSEKWLSNKELQTALAKAKHLIIDAASKSNDPTASALLDGPLWEVLENAGLLVLEDFDVQLSRPSICFVSYKYNSKTIEQLLTDSGQTDFAKEKIGNDTVHVGLADRAGVTQVLGFHGDHLIFASSKQLWEKVSKRIDASQRAPLWARELFADQPIRRLANFGVVHISRIKDLLLASKDPSFDQALDAIDHLGLDALIIKQGTDKTSNVSVIQAKGNRKGLLSTVDSPPFTNEQLKEFPDDCTAAIGIKLSPDNILNLIQQFLPDQPISKLKALEEFKKRFGINLKADLLDHLSGELRGFSSGSILKPKMIGIIGIKDANAFQSTLETLNEKVQEQIGDGPGKFSEKTGRDGVTVYGFKNPLGSSVYWAFHESELLFGSNSRAISSFLRKRKSRESSFPDQPLVAAILGNPPADSLGPVGFQLTDMNQIIEALLPMASIALNFIPPDSGIDISPDDIPSPAALRGLRPNVSVGYLTKTGGALISRYDTPVSMEASYGVLIGMLLPAVQQARAAAQRTQTLNNFRQLALAALNFESANRRFPAAFSVDEDGKPLLSWRVHLLPYLEEQELYEKFHLDEPWDSPHNIKLLEEMPQVYQSISTKLPEGHTMALAPAADDTIISQKPSDGNLGVELTEITDGSSNTILFIEGGSENAVPWTAPKDLDLEEVANTNFNTGRHRKFCVVLADGSTRLMDNSLTLNDFLGICLMNDGELMKP